jgi:hypothetical protein
VAHFVIDGAIRSDTRVEPAHKPDSYLDPDAIALGDSEGVSPKPISTFSVNLAVLGHGK